MIQILKSLSETKKIANKLAKKIKNGGIIFFTGDLGSGKTTIIKFICEFLGIKKSQVKSPTYTYIRQYKLKNRNIYHIDLYRLDCLDDVLEREIFELISDKKNIVLIEWAEKMKNTGKISKINVNLEYIDDHCRKIIF